MWSCIFDCIARRIGFWAAVSLGFFIVALLATAGNVILAAIIAGIVLGGGTLTIALNCFISCRG